MKQSPIAIILFTVSIFSVVGCGGGGGESDSTTPTPPPVVVENPTVSFATVTEVAIEKSNTLAKFKVDRIGASGALEVQFNIFSDDSTNVHYASQSDVKLVYSDGGDVGETIHLSESQNSRVIEVHPIQDQQHEVVEQLIIDLAASSTYQSGTEQRVILEIADAENTNENGKVFIGYFSAQKDAITIGSGVMSLVLQGDNEQALLSYEFSGLGSEQTDQHIHLAPSGTMIKDIEHLGALSNYVWDLSPGGPFTSKQQMIDALFEGKFFLNIHTAEYPAGEISATLNFDVSVEPPSDTTLTIEDIDRDIIRFLNQATFGATPEDFTTLKSQMNASGSNRLQVYEAWIDQQMLLPVTSMLELTDATNAHFPEEDGWHARRDAFWPIALYGKDQLRQRVTFSLSEILVIGDQMTTVRKAYRGTADYWDTLAQQAFGQYNELLNDVSRHAVMGIWLSHLKNAKADADQGIFPDENYAREIMQLFSFGLVHRQANGSTKLGANNLPQPTYDNEVIKSLARVFTGLSFSKANSGETMVDNSYFLKGNGTNEYQYRWTEPMKFFVNFHDFDEKVLFHNGVEQVHIAATEPSVVNADAELSQVMDALVAHPTTAPFIARRLIQRLVTSNPSYDYIFRVSSVFGQTGDLSKTIKAILLDPEARNPSVVSSALYGKVKEPIIRFSALMRLLSAYSSIGFDEQGLNYPAKAQYEEGVSLLRLGEISIGQYSLGAESVFNFFLPDFTPTGQLASQSLVAPELQLMTESQLVTTMNVSHTLINHALVRNSAFNKSEYSKDDVKVKLNIDSLEALWQSTQGSEEDKARAVVSYLDFYLNAGQLLKANSQHSYQAILDATIPTSALDERLKMAIYGVMNAPESLVQQ